MLATLIHDQAAWVKWLVFLLAVGLLVTLSPITPFTTEDGIPITLQSLLVVFLPILLGWRVGVAAVVAYLIIGGLGAPVFSYGQIFEAKTDLCAPNERLVSVETAKFDVTGLQVCWTGIGARPCEATKHSGGEQLPVFELYRHA